MLTFRQDFRFAVRMLLKHPIVTLVAIVSLALGIGANTAIFSLLDTLLLKPLAVANPEELVFYGPAQSSGLITGDRGRSMFLFSHPLYKEYRGHHEVFADVAAFESTELTLSLTVTSSPESGMRSETVQGRLVSGSYFPTLGVQAFLGRSLAESDDEVPGGHPVAVISHGFWKRRFALDPAAVGQSIVLNEAPFTIVGVMREDFLGETIGRCPDFWIPIMMQAQLPHWEAWLDSKELASLIIMARLRPGISREEAETSVNVRLQQILTAEAGSEITPELQRAIRETRIELTPAGRGRSGLRRRYSDPLLILMGMVALVLLVACVNVANLLLARATARQREIGVRVAMGASSTRLIRQLLTESLLLSIAGGALGLLFAWWGSQSLVTLVPRNSFSDPINFELNGRILGFAASVSMLTGILFGLAPALRAARVDLSRAFKDHTRSTGGGVPRMRLGKLLVIAQVAMSLPLLIGAGLFVGSLQQLNRIDPGFDRDNVLQVEIDSLAAGYQKPQLTGLYQRLIEKVDSLPGVRSTGMSMFGLMGGPRWMSDILVQGDIQRPEEDTSVQVSAVTPGYFETVRMPLLLGRDFSLQDNESAPKVAVINETVAQFYFGNENPVGRRFGFGDDPNDSGGIEIVGVVKDAKYNDLREEPVFMIFLPAYQEIDHLYALVVRTSGDPGALADRVRNVVNETDRSLPVLRIAPMREQLDRSLAREHLIARLAGFFGLLALTLSCIGIYGIMAYSVACRSGEIGIRMALGAQSTRILQQVLRESGGLILIGAAIGILLALAGTRLVSSMLFGLSATDPVTILLATMVLLAVALMAGYIPARKAARIDPMLALRCE